MGAYSALWLKHQAISIHSADKISIVLDQLHTEILHQLISPWCRIYASVNEVSIGSDNGLSPIRRQAII